MRKAILSALLCPLLAAAAPEVLVVRAARMLDVRTGQVQRDPVVVVRGERIEAVGAGTGFAIPKGARVLDLGDVLLLPGLVDCHEHILGNWKDESITGVLRQSSAEGVLWGIRNLQVFMQHGFTTIRDAGEADLGYGQLALRNAISKGLLKGPRIVSAGNMISITGGHGDEDCLAPDQGLARRPNLADTVEQMGTAVRRDLKYGADWIKLAATGGVADVLSDYDAQELSEAQMAAAVELAHRAGRRVMAHAEGAAGIKAAVRAGVDSIEHGTVLDEEGARLMAEKGTWLVPTLYAFQHGAETGTSLGADPIMVRKTVAILKHQQPAFALALKYHLKIAFGVDDDPEVVSREFTSLVKGGMTPLAAIQAATVRGAELLGLQDSVGTVEQGKFADLVAVAGDPLAHVEDMEKIRFVMKGGEVFPLPGK